ncbi:MAG TPA: hypothetical protein VL995_12885 [Cellvibrio sp.]|nr:hypothetical protein [Cellvibrio sp.]
MRKIFIALSFVFCHSSFSNEVIETWECQETSYGQWTNILVQAQVIKGRTEGKIYVAGVSHSTAFEVKGFNRRWDFGLTDDGTYKFAFVVKPNGTASYYDFTLESQSGPSMILHCRQK